MALVPDPKKPTNLDRNPGLKRAWEHRIEAARYARSTITQLRTAGKGQQLNGSQGTFWGVLNAFLEYVDHYQDTKQPRLVHALFGDGMDLKVKAFQKILQEARQAA